MLFLASGAGLLAITYALVAGVPPIPAVHEPVNTTTGRVPPQQLQAALSAATNRQHTAELHQLLVRSGIALTIMAAMSVALGWIVAGRVLRPLRTITTAAKLISEENLHERLALRGPRDELLDLADTIDGLLARLQGAFDAQRNFVANASHELRTPLTLARALLQMRLRDPYATAESFRSTCEEVLTAGEQQDRLIESLLTLARSQRGLDHHESLDLAVIVTELAEAHQAAAAARGVRLDVHAFPALVSGDPYLVDRLISNLLENALRYNITDGSVRVLVQQQDGRPTLQVTNSGPHVPSDHIDRLLQPFQRIATERVGDNEGLGLGLSIVAAIATAHGAVLDISSKEEGGLDVTIGFPRTISHNGSGPCLAAPQATPPLDAGRGSM
jgi:signal transduction histidine kinase